METGLTRILGTLETFSAAELSVKMQLEYYILLLIIMHNRDQGLFYRSHVKVIFNQG